MIQIYICMYTYTYILFFRSFPITSYYKILNIVPCGIQCPCLSILYIAVCLFYSQSLNLSLPFLYPLVTNHKFVFSVCESILFCISCIIVHLYHCLGSTYKWFPMIFIFLCQTYFTYYYNLYIHLCCYKWPYCTLFYGWVGFHCTYIYTYTHIHIYISYFHMYQVVHPLMGFR